MSVETSYTDDTVLTRKTINSSAYGPREHRPYGRFRPNLKKSTGTEAWPKAIFVHF